MNDKIDYFIERTEKDIDELKSSHAALHEKIDLLLQFKWQIIGGATVLAALVSTVISVFSLLAKTH